MTAAWAFAFAAGMLATFNPCGFALLPAYLSLFLANRSGDSAVIRALLVGGTVTIGFVLTFGLAGVAISALSLRFGDWLSIVTIVMGVGLLVLGGFLLAGRSPSFRLPRARLPVSESWLGMVSYGIVYATVSLSCTLPVFMAAVATSFGAGGGLWEGTGSFLAYALGMGAVLTAIALALALFEEGAGARIRRITPYLSRISGAFLILAGVYVIWYGWVEYLSFQGEIVTGGPTAWVAQASANVSTWLSDVPIWSVIVGLAALALAGILIGTLRRRGTGSTIDEGAATDATSPAAAPSEHP